MDFKDLRIFVRVAAVQNLTTVAGAMGLSAGTVSKRIQSLEDELGVRLLDRTTRSSRLTEEGRMFLERAERMLAEMDLAKDEISTSTGQPSGRLAVTAPASLARQIVQPAILGFIDAFPSIEIRVDISDNVINLHEAGYDAAIRFGTLPDSTLKAKRLAGDRIILVASPRYIERHGAPQRPDDIPGHTSLIHDEQRNWTLARGGERSTVRAEGRLVSGDGSFLHQAALAGAGLLRTSEIAAMDDLLHGRLVHVLPEYEFGSEAAVWAVYPNAKNAMPRVRAFVDHLAQFCRERIRTGQPAQRLAQERNVRQLRS